MNEYEFNVHRDELTERLTRSIGHSRVASCIAELAIATAKRRFAEWDQEEKSFESFLFDFWCGMAEKWLAPAVSLDNRVYWQVQADMLRQYKSWDQFPEGEFEHRRFKELKLALLNSEIDYEMDFTEFDELSAIDDDYGLDSAA